MVVNSYELGSLAAPKVPDTGILQEPQFIQPASVPGAIFPRRSPGWAKLVLPATHISFRSWLLNNCGGKLRRYCSCSTRLRTEHKTELGWALRFLRPNPSRLDAWGWVSVAEREAKAEQVSSAAAPPIASIVLGTTK